MFPTGTSQALSDDENKGQSFRKRRLSLPSHNLPAAEDGSVAQVLPQEKELPPENYEHEDEEDTTSPGDASSPDLSEKAQSFRKRRLSVPNLNNLLVDTSEEPPTRRQRRDSAGSIAPNNNDASKEKEFPSKTLHASELLSHHDEPPPSPAVHADNILYHTKPLPPQAVLPPTASPTTAEPKWKKRLTIRHKHEDHKLPFPRDVVGTYSCHGVEPLYNSAYAEDDDEEEDDDDQDWDEDVEKGVSQGVHAATSGELFFKPKAVAAKINQDRGGMAFPYGNCPRTALFAVYDGHGQGGELVSQYVLHEMQHRLERHKSFPDDLETAFTETFHAIDEDLKKEPLIEPVYAGTTACVALLKEDTLTLANVGDSRAVMARKRADGNWDSIPLTEDQNPDLPQELNRIVAAGGFVTSPPAPGLSARVWLDQACTQIGLAMARSIGDHAVSKVGVIATPVVTTYDVDANDDFLVLASDGVWEFLESEDTVRIVAANLDRGATKACQALIEAAAARWYEEEGEYRDDITAIVVCLSQLWDDGPSGQSPAPAPTEDQQ